MCQHAQYSTSPRVNDDNVYRSSLCSIHFAFLEEQHMDDAGPISTSTERDEPGVNIRTLLSPDALPVPTLDSIVHRWWLSQPVGFRQAIDTGGSRINCDEELPHPTLNTNNLSPSLTLAPLLKY